MCTVYLFKHLDETYTLFHKHSSWFYYQDFTKTVQWNLLIRTLSTLSGQLQLTIVAHLLNLKIGAYFFLINNKKDTISHQNVPRFTNSGASKRKNGP